MLYDDMHATKNPIVEKLLYNPNIFSLFSFLSNEVYKNAVSQPDNPAIEIDKNALSNKNIMKVYDLKKIILDIKNIKLEITKVFLYPNSSANHPQGTSNNIVNIQDIDSIINISDKLIPLDSLYKVATGP